MNKATQCDSKLRLSTAEKKCSQRICNLNLIKKDLLRMCLWQKCRVNQSKYAEVDSCYQKICLEESEIVEDKRCSKTERCKDKSLVFVTGSKKCVKK
jgi:hypothetical protein